MYLKTLLKYKGWQNFLYDWLPIAGFLRSDLFPYTEYFHDFGKLAHMFYADRGDEGCDESRASPPNIVEE